jgi:hypothetical protein
MHRHHRPRASHRRRRACHHHRRARRRHRVHRGPAGHRPSNQQPISTQLK